MADLTADLGFIQLKNPVIPASGTFGYGTEFQEFFDLDLLGALVLKGVYISPRNGNPPPRIWETPSGLLNSIGLAGPGAEGLVPVIKDLASRTSTPVIVNVCGSTDEEYLEVARVFDQMEEISMLELNISCPNVRAGGSCPAQNEIATGKVVDLVKKNTKKPLIVKLSPNVSDVASIARAAESSGADAVSVVNTFLGLAIDVYQRKPVFRNFFAGLSGPAIKPLALKIVWEVANAVSIPVIGIGGIMTGSDVLEFIMAGASAVQTGTVNIIEPTGSVRIISETRALMEKMNIHHLKEIRGCLRT
jgi:dihydroorotate dehydrogenase (NAD+) catalytic subunit